MLHNKNPPLNKSQEQTTNFRLDGNSDLNLRIPRAGNYPKE